MSDQYQDGSDMTDKRSGPQPDEANRRAEEDEWTDEAEGESSAGSQEQWVEEPVAAGKPKPKEASPYMTWVAGAIGLLLGLFAFRSCGQ